MNPRNNRGASRGAHSRDLNNASMETHNGYTPQGAGKVGAHSRPLNEQQNPQTANPRAATNRDANPYGNPAQTNVYPQAGQYVDQHQRRDNKPHVRSAAKEAAAKAQYQDMERYRAYAAQSVVPVGEYGKEPYMPKKKMSTGKKVGITVSVVLILLIAGCGIALSLFLNNMNSQIQDIDEDVFQVLEKPADPEEPFYVLLLGSDTRVEGGFGRSDTIVLARIDTAKKAVTLVSIPRDTQVQIEGHGTQKINAAFAFGGISGAVRAVSAFAGVPISHVMEVDFFGFKDIVNALGGVTVNVPKNTSYQGVTLPSGKQHLNGEEALVFVRCRKTYGNGDYQRTQNQRQLLTVVANEILTAPITEMPGLIESLAKSVSTDMSITDIIGLATSMRGMKSDAIMSATVPSHSGMQNGVSYIFTEEPAWSQMMERVKAGEDPNPPNADGAKNAEENLGSTEDE